MRRRFFLSAVGCLLVASATWADESGVLILAHGGSSRWNKTVTDTVRQAALTQPTEIAFGMGMHEGEVAAIQHAVDALERRGVSRIVAVPLLVSSSSEVMRQFEYLLGRRDHGPWEAHAKPVSLRVPVVLTAPLDDDPVVSEILLERALAMSASPPQESVVVVAHGPNSDDDNVRWLDVMDRIASRLRSQGRFRAVVPVTMRDDAPGPVRQAATRRIREVVGQQSAQGRTLVVPLLLASGGIEDKIPQRLRGLSYAFRGDALLPHPKLAQWIAKRVAELAAPVSTQVAHAGSL